MEQHGKRETERVTVERFVPRGRTSLEEDAPGWGPPIRTRTTEDLLVAPNSCCDHSADEGPICWKCQGTGQKRLKTARANDTKTGPPCSVCKGKGRLAVKSNELASLNRSGVIKKARCPGWGTPMAHGLQENSNDSSLTKKWRNMVVCADMGQDVMVPSEQDGDDVVEDDCGNNRPPWLPRRGEEFCKLNGAWRILQRIGGHRWTTDDCVTAYIAVRDAMRRSTSDTTTATPLRYLDLGTGNGSVLQMVLRALLQHGFDVSATGIEARKEAVDLARRSLLFNVGPDFPVGVVHGDFRDLLMEKVVNQMQHGFDLITGTPPYFRVDFHVRDGRTVQSAIIREGGMPSARQSAPARCEFRGGIEAYCEAAARAIKVETGRFVVCENFLNHERVLRAARDTGLQVLHVVKVQGRQGRKPLFCVYVMRKSDNIRGASTTAQTEAEVTEEVLVIRDDEGNWTKAYTETVFRTMSIPPLSPSLSTHRY